MPKLKEKEVQERLKAKLEAEKLKRESRFAKLRSLMEEDKQFEEQIQKEEEEKQKKLKELEEKQARLADKEGEEKDLPEKKQGGFGFLGGLFKKKEKAEGEVGAKKETGKAEEAKKELKIEEKGQKIEQIEETFEKKEFKFGEKKEEQEKRIEKVEMKKPSMKEGFLPYRVRRSSQAELSPSPLPKSEEKKGLQEKKSIFDFFKKKPDDKAKDVATKIEEKKFVQKIGAEELGQRKGEVKSVSVGTLLKETTASSQPKEEKGDELARRLQEMIRKAEGKGKEPEEVSRIGVKAIGISGKETAAEIPRRFRDERYAPASEKEEMVEMVFEQIDSKEELTEHASQLTMEKVKEFKSRHDRLPTSQEYDDIAGEIFDQIKDKYDELDEKEKTKENIVVSEQGQKIDVSNLSRRERRKFEREGQPGTNKQEKKEERGNRRHGRRGQEEEPKPQPQVQSSTADFESSTEDLFGGEASSGDEFSLDLDADAASEESDLGGLDLGLEEHKPESEKPKPQPQAFAPKACPTCNAPTLSTKFCPKCGSEICTLCAKAKDLGTAIALTCPNCGNNFKALKK